MADFTQVTSSSELKIEGRIGVSDEAIEELSKMSLLSASSGDDDDDFYGIPKGLSPNIMQLSHLIKLMGLEETTSIDVEKKNITMARRVVLTAVELLPEDDSDSGIPASHSQGQAENKKESPTCDTDEGHEWCLARPFTATLKNARWLTTPIPSSSSNITKKGETLESRLSTWGEERRVVHMDLDLGDSGINYLPGDSLGFLVRDIRYKISQDHTL